QWLENIEDWCISRQLWWGHRIPVWYHKETGEIYCEVDPPKDIENYVQDEDVLDTWFSSALWPFSTLGWPEETEDLKRYFPTSCMVTGYDIIFFWVARMAFSARHFLNDVPFRDCLIHGLIRDEKGRKMSKSLGNGVDPIDVIDNYGCDSLRLFILTNSTPGLDTNYSKEKIEAGWSFINKFWNAARYVLMNRPEGFKLGKLELKSAADHWIINELNKCIDSVTLNLDRYEFGIAGNEAMSFVWDDFCSLYIEFSKAALTSDNEEEKLSTLNTLIYVLDALTRMLHPFIPFVSEEIYQEIHGKESSVCTETWPKKVSDIDTGKAGEVNQLIEIIKLVRELRSQHDIKPSKELRFHLEGLDLNSEYTAILYRMCKIVPTDAIEGESLVRPISDATISFTMSDIVNKEEELKKIDQELKRLEGEIRRSNGILSNEKFLAKAPAAKVEEERQKLAHYQASYDTLAKQKEELSR
ncbi:MAG: class I tRNA ligase family protein, partial [Erysipelotrichaceae bacterium]|nr:class I tRNA ligase family protein [Erysipelotrichaceae bacterium]